ncbi:molybdopterin molybdotransferase MoeA [Jonesiaceae bacterium BS-20]|uniref:Molybdopterin molybdenumtransferase n=1 Tax=Jonesiaceae bacterium BS-20 TaxID=3120821 RepID=A0AAU7E0Z4_9MICO
MTQQLPLIEPQWAHAHHAAFLSALPVSEEQIGLDQAVGRVLAHPVTSLTDLPRDVTSAMDGYAVSTPSGPWPIVGSSLAGHPMSGALEPGTCAVIATGAVVPDGTFGVVRHEFTDVSETDSRSLVTLNSDNRGEPFANSHVRPAGAEALAGETLIAAGTLLTPAHVGLAAVSGNDIVSVRRPVTAAILIMGDEVSHTGLPQVGQIRDAFAPQFPQYASMLGLTVVETRFIADTLESAVDAIASADVDVVITTGGTAAGPADFLHRALAQLHGQLIIDMIAMRPGHPNLLARLGENKFLVGLPGNPLSASLGGMLTLTRPLVRGLLGRPNIALGTVRTSQDVSAPAADSRLVPYTLSQTDQGPVATENKWLNSAMLRGFATAHGVMVVPPGGAVAGQEVVDLPLAWPTPDF